MGIPKGKGRDNDTKAILEAIMTENFPQIKVRQQTIRLSCLLQQIAIDWVT